MMLGLAGGQDTRERKGEPCAKMATVCRHDLVVGPNKRRIPASARHIARTRDEHSSLQPQSAPITVQNGENGYGCHHDHGMGPNKRHIQVESRPVTRTRDEHSAVQLQGARTVQHRACGDECRPQQEWPPFVTTTMELDETKARASCTHGRWRTCASYPTM